MLALSRLVQDPLKAGQSTWGREPRPVRFTVVSPVQVAASRPFNAFSSHASNAQP